MTKTCNKCGETKPLEEFHKHCKSLDGHAGHCKECQQAIDKAWSQANKERRAATDKAWREANKERHAATVKAWNEANKERKAATTKAWNEANPDKVKAQLERAKERWPEKVAARKAVSNAITSGKLVRQPCEVCGSTDVRGHHDDYRQPLVVRWLCPVHHTECHTTSH